MKLGPKDLKPCRECGAQATIVMPFSDSYAFARCGEKCGNVGPSNMQADTITQAILDWNHDNEVTT